MSNNVNDDMETMNLRKLSIKMSVPMVVSMVCLALYNLIDSIFISNIGTEALTAISLSFPIQAIITGIALGTGIGVNSLISRKLGEKKNDVVKNAVLHGIVLMIITYILIAILGTTILRGLFSYFTKDELTINYAVQYLSICMVFSIGLLFQILFEKISEAFGKPTYSMIIQFSGAVINLVLDPILIYGLHKIPGLGIKGAAIATIIGQCSGMLIGFILLMKEKISLNLKKITFDFTIIREIYAVGLPSIISESLAAFVSLILNKLLLSYSAFAVPFWGIYNKVQSFIFMIVYGFNYGMIPIVGYNYGAKRYDRMKKTIKIFIGYSESIMLVGILIFMAFGKVIFNIYGSQKEIMDIGIIAFRILSIGFAFAGISLVLSSVFQAIGKGTYSLMIFGIRQLIINIPVIFVLRNQVDINKLWYVFVISEFIAMMVGYILYKNSIKKIDTDNAQIEE